MYTVAEHGNHSGAGAAVWALAANSSGPGSQALQRLSQPVQPLLSSLAERKMHRQPLSKCVSSSRSLEESLSMLRQDINSSYNSICAARGMQPPLLQQGRLPAAAAAAAAFAPSTALPSSANWPKTFITPQLAAAPGHSGGALAPSCISTKQQHTRQLHNNSLYSSTPPALGSWQCSTFACSRQAPAALALQHVWSSSDVITCAAANRFRSSTALQQQFQAAVGHLQANTTAMVFKTAAPLALEMPPYKQLCRLDADPLECQLSIA